MAKRNDPSMYSSQGASNYKSLQEKNSENFTITPEERESLQRLSQGPSYGDFSHYMIEHAGPGKSALNQATGGKDFFGNSMWDDTGEIYTEDQMNDFNFISDQRGEHQWKIAQLGAGIAKGVGLAATTFLDGTAGLIAGTVQGVSNLFDDDEDSGFLNGYYNNPFSNEMNEFNKTMEELFPNYRTAEERTNEWYQNIGTMNFLADSLLKNAGFIVGAYYSGGAWNKVLKAIGALKNATAAQWIGSALSGFTEARVEANHSFNDYRDLRMTGAKDDYNRSKRDILDSNLSDEEKAKELELLDANMAEIEKSINSDALNMGTKTLLLNTAYLTLSNVGFIGKLYRRGFENAKATNGGGFFSNLFGGNITGGVRREGSNIVSDLAYNAGKKLAPTAQGLASGVNEAAEEMNQALISDWAGNSVTYDDPDAYYKALNSKSATEALASMPVGGDAFKKAFSNTWGNASRWEEGFAGFITGIMGVPTFGKANNSQAGTYLGKGKMVGMSGGIFGEYAEANNRNQKMQQAVDGVNKFVKDISGNAAHFARRSAFGDAMDGYSAADDKFEYKNSDDNATYEGIAAFAQAGRLGDLKEIINRDYAHASDEELDQIARSTTPNVTTTEEGDVVTKDSDGKPLRGGWRNADGSLMSSTEEGRAKMREELEERKKQMLEDVDKFEKAQAIVRGITNNMLDNDEANEMAWLLYKQEKFKDRWEDSKKGLGSYIDRLEEILRDASEEEGPKYSTVDEVRNSIKGNKRAKEDLNNLREFLKAIKEGKSIEVAAAIVEANPQFLKYAQYIADNIIQDPEMSDAIKKIADMGRIAVARRQFADRFAAFKKDPMGIRANREKIYNDIKEERENVKKEATKETVKNMTVDDLVGNSETKGFTFDEIDKAVDGDLELTNKVNTAKEKKKDTQGVINKIYKNPSTATELAEATLAKNAKGKDNIEDITADEVEELTDEDLEELSATHGLEIFTAEEAQEINAITNSEGVTEEQAKAYIKSRRQAKVKEAKDIVTRSLSQYLKDKKKAENLKNAESATVDSKSPETGNDPTAKPDPVDRTEKKIDDDENLVVETTESTDGIEQDDLDDNSEGVVNTNTSVDNTIKDSNSTMPSDYVKTNTTETAKNAAKGTHVPYYTTEADIPGSNRKAVHEVVFKYLQKKGAFANVKNGLAKEGTKLHLVVDPELNAEVQEITNDDTVVPLWVDENGNIVGDLMTEVDDVAARNGKNYFDSYRQTYEYVKRKYNESSKDAIFSVPNTETTVQSVLIGQPKYSKENDRRPISESIENPIFGVYNEKDGEKKIIIDSKDSSVGIKSDLEHTVVMPRNAKRGQLYVLIKTGSSKRSYIPIPVTMPAVKLGDKGFESTPIGSFVSGKLARAYDNARTIGIDYDKVEKIQDTVIKPLLDALSVSSIIFTTDKKTGAARLKVKIGNRKFTITAKSSDPSLAGALMVLYDKMKNDPEHYTVLARADIDKLNNESKQLDDPVNNRDVTYAEGLAMSVSTNLVAKDPNTNVGAESTVNDFPIMDPYKFNDKGDIIGTEKATPPSSTGTSNKSTEATPSEPTVSNSATSSMKEVTVNFKGKNYTAKVDNNGNIFHVDGTPVSPTTSEHRAIASAIEAAAKGVFTGTIQTNYTMVDKESGKAVELYDVEKQRLVPKQYIDTVEKCKKLNIHYTIEGRKGQRRTYDVTPVVKLHDDGLISITFHTKVTRLDGTISESDTLGFPIDFDLIDWSATTIQSSWKSDGTPMTLEDVTDEDIENSKGVLLDLLTNLLTGEVRNPTLTKLIIATDGRVLGHFRDITGNFLLKSNPLEMQNIVAPYKSSYESKVSKEIKEKSASKESEEETQKALDYNKKEIDKNNGQAAQAVTNTNPIRQENEAVTNTSTKSKEDIEKSITEKYPDMTPYIPYLSEEVKEAIDNTGTKESVSDFIANNKPLLRKKDKKNIQKNAEDIFINDRKFSTVEDEILASDYERWDKDKELERVAKMCPHLSKEERVTLVTDIEKIAGKGNPKAWGMYHRGAIALYNNALAGTAYHEAFHYVLDALCSLDEVSDIFEKAKKAKSIVRAIEAKRGEGAINTINNDDLEEYLADAFKEYCLYQQEIEDAPGIMGFFKRLKNRIRTLFKAGDAAEQIFRSIYRGNYANRSERKFNPTKRGRVESIRILKEMDDIKARAITVGTFMKAPNGADTHLSEDQWLQVRTKAFKDWFGDWENDPDNASKAVDENGEPKVYYHTVGDDFDDSFNVFDTEIEGKKTAIYVTDNKKMSSSYSRALNMSIEDRKYSNSRLLKKLEYDRQQFSDTLKKLRDPSIEPEAKKSLEAKLKEYADKVIKDQQLYGKFLNAEDTVDKVKPLFVNTKTPLIVEGNGANWNSLPMTEGMTLKSKDSTATTRQYEEFIKDKNEYDGAIFKDIYDYGPGTYGVLNGTGTVISVKNPNQIKSATDNIGTFDPNENDIRYSRVGSSADVSSNYKTYKNLLNEDKQYLENRKITEKMFNSMSPKLREKVLECS